MLTAVSGLVVAVRRCETLLSSERRVRYSVWWLAPRAQWRAEHRLAVPGGEATAVSGVLETLYSGLGGDSALVCVIIEQMKELIEQR